ncbi:hypothetical protein [Planomicrobium sp. CPCC 101079]|uniref:DUF6115 domain-containing protein n=1 Tax=Planomicrobium sp. CPCC 101079 TaxID=2599618 RepID=UPI002106209D|nr:hypothetical protein [Planomicrobium sp. CPCC 101079]
MEWLLVAILLILAIYISIKSFVGMTEIKQQRQQMIEESEALSQSMEDFVAKLEKENDELYHNLVNYIKVKESGLEQKIRNLEEKLGELSAVSPASQTFVPEDKVSGGKEEKVDHSMQEQEKIAQLYKQGFSAKQIAKVLQLEQGKVELAVNLYSRKKSYQN